MQMLLLLILSNGEKVYYDKGQRHHQPRSWLVAIYN